MAFLGVALGYYAPFLYGLAGAAARPRVGRDARTSRASCRSSRRPSSTRRRCSPTSRSRTSTCWWARSVLDSHDSGLYAAGLIVTRAVMFLPQFVVVVAFPSMSTASQPCPRAPPQHGSHRGPRRRVRPGHRSTAPISHWSSLGAGLRRGQRPAVGLRVARARAWRSCSCWSTRCSPVRASSRWRSSGSRCWWSWWSASTVVSTVSGAPRRRAHGRARAPRRAPAHQPRRSCGSAQPLSERRRASCAPCRWRRRGGR